MSLIVKARGIAESHRLLDGVADRTGGEHLDELLPTVLEIQEEWWASLGRGSWRGLDLEDTGRLLAASTREGAAGQHVDVDGDELVFGLEPGGPDDPGTYGGFLAGMGLSPIAEPSGADASRLAEEYGRILVGENGVG